MTCWKPAEFHRLADEILITGRIPEIGRLLMVDKFEPASDKLAPNLQQATSIPDAVDSVLSRAICLSASDIHLEPSQDNTHVRYRVDGQLQSVAEIPTTSSREFISRLKVICNMDIAEKRRPQDGRFHFTGQGRNVDVRVSTIPTEFGEKMVLRLLDQEDFALDLAQIGMDECEQGALSEAVGRTQGMVLVTGPTGSGKTTTLYSCLQRIRDPRLNIMTIEDPIEYRLEGINQSQVKPDIGYDFAKALRAFLRQDPNVIMVGEIRDAETAQIALRAAMTGHLVLSSVHTNDAATTVTRLLDLGAEPYLVASSLSLIVAQRLVRRLCTECRQPVDSCSERTSKAVGCPTCNETGYRGRVGVFEVLPVDPAIQEMIHARAPAERIRDKARASGMRLLSDAGRGKWLEGLTTLEEVEREIGSIESNYSRPNDGKPPQ